MKRLLMLSAAPIVLGSFLMASPVLAGSTHSSPASRNAQQSSAKARGDEASSAQNLVNESVNVVEKMKKDPQLLKLMEKAKGIYIVPEFGRGAFIVGGRGGAGVVLVHQDGKWSDPLFFNMGGISIGAQAGGSGGAIAMLLMTDDAVNSFKSKNNFSLNAGAGISIVTYSANGQASWGKGDIVLWSDTAGAYAGATVSITDVSRNDDGERAFYGKQATPQQILSGQVETRKDDALQRALPG